MVRKHPSDASILYLHQRDFGLAVVTDDKVLPEPRPLAITIDERCYAQPFIADQRRSVSGTCDELGGFPFSTM